MGWFGSSVSGDEIHQVVLSHMQKFVGSPTEILEQSYEQKFKDMLASLDEWATGLKLGDWKRSSIVGSIETVMRNTYKGQFLDQTISQYVKLAQQVILQ